MLRRLGVELIKRQMVLALNDFQSIKFNRRDYGAVFAANRAIASAWVFDSIRQCQFKAYRTTMT